MNYRSITRAAIVAAAVFAAPASATIVTSLPGGTALAIPAAQLTNTTATQTIAPGITADPSNAFAFGYTGTYGFNGNGSWSGTSMIGLNNPTGSFDILFANAISGFLGEINWTSINVGGNTTLAAYNSVGTLLESLTLEIGGVNQVTPGFYGFSRATADISAVRFTNDYVGVRNISTVAATAAVPEPATWAMMLVGFGAIGFAMRRKQRQTVRLNFA